MHIITCYCQPILSRTT